jgi:hypothetical protein
VSRLEESTPSAAVRGILPNGLATIVLRLLTRTGFDWTHRYERIAGAKASNAALLMRSNDLACCSDNRAQSPHFIIDKNCRLVTSVNRVEPERCSGKNDVSWQ